MLCMVIVGGMGNISGVIVGALLLEYLNLKGLDKIGERINDGSTPSASTRTIDIPKYKFLIFGIAARGDDAVPTRGPDPERAAQGRARGRGEEHPTLYDVRT